MKFWVFFYLTALYLAIKKSNTEIVKIMLSKPGVDINIKNVSKKIIYTILTNYLNIVWN